MLSIIQDGPDYTSLLGSNIAENNRFYFVSANGYNIFNGVVFVYLKNITVQEHTLFATIHVPEILNSNFGLFSSANDYYLAIGGISYDVYNGVIFIYRFFRNKWIYFQRLQDQHNYGVFLLGFGINIALTTNNQLIVTNYKNDIYVYIFDDEQGIFVERAYTEAYLSSQKMSIVHDNHDNLIVSYFTNTLYTYSLNDHTHKLLHSVDEIPTCFYGSYLFLHQDILFVSCSLYYPFDSMPYVVENYLFAYKLHYTNTTIQSIEWVDTIMSPNTDMYFGTNIAVTDNHLLVVGTNCIYQYDVTDNTRHLPWTFRAKYTIPESVINYDYKVKVYDTYFVVGNYGFNDLQGGLFTGDLLIDLPDDNSVNQKQTMQDMIQKNKLHKMYLVFLIFFIILSLLLGVFVCYICFHHPIPLDKKKKKEEEEESPYKVYSYMGYSETDYIYTPPVPQPPVPYMFQPYYMVPFMFPFHTYQPYNDMYKPTDEMDNAIDKSIYKDASLYKDASVSNNTINKEESNTDDPATDKINSLYKMSTMDELEKLYKMKE